MKKHLYYISILILLLLTLFSCKKNGECTHSPEVYTECEAEATCTTAGRYTSVVKCTACETTLESVTKESEKLKHTPSNEVKETIALPTCVSNGCYTVSIYCLECGEKLSSEERTDTPLGHKTADPIKENYINPTCQSNGGYDECTYCQRCGDLVSSVHIETSQSDAHITNIIPGYPATETTDGLTNGSTCDLCGAILQEQAVIPAALQGTDLSSDEFIISDNILCLTVASSVSEISFGDLLKTNSKSSYYISLDAHGSDIIENKIASLNNGENIYYVTVIDSDGNTKIYTASIYRKSLYKITFNTDGADEIEPVYVEEGECISPPIPNRENYTFEGWDYNFNLPINSSFTATAIWKSIYGSYKVEIYLENVAKDGYDLSTADTHTEKLGTSVFANADEIPHFTFDTSNSTIEGIVTDDNSLTLKLYYTRNTYNIQSTSDRGEVIGLGEYAYGYTVNLTVYEKNGYRFVGWYDGKIYISSQLSFSFSVDRDITAVWEIVTYSVKYYDGNRPLSTDLTSYTVSDGEISLPDAYKEHYQFVGWYATPELTGDMIKAFNSELACDLTFYARFIEVNYSITYNLGGGINSSLNPKSYNVSSVLPITIYPPSRRGYVFLGWYTDSSFTNEISKVTRLVGNLTLYAKWEKEEPTDPTPPVTEENTITYIYDNTVLAHYPDTYNPGYTVRLVDYCPDHYTFLGWYTHPSLDEETRIYQINKNMSGSVTLYAKLAPTPYTITYHTNGGSIDTPTSQVYNITSSFPLTLPTPQKDGYYFGGWYTDEALTQPIVTINDVMGNIDLYAAYGKPAEPEIPNDKFVIKYMDGDDRLYLEPDVYNAGSILPLATYQKAGYTFIGWFTTSTFDAGTQIFYIDETTSGDLTLYAKMEPI